MNQIQSQLVVMSNHGIYNRINTLVSIYFIVPPKTDFHSRFFQSFTTFALALLPVFYGLSCVNTLMRLLIHLFEL